MRSKMYDGKAVPTEAAIMIEAEKTGFKIQRTSVNLGWSAPWLSNQLARDATLRKRYNAARDLYLAEAEKLFLREARRTGFNAVHVSLNLGWSRDWFSKRLAKDASLRKRYNSAREQYFIELEARALREAEKTGFNAMQASLNLGRGAFWISNRLYNYTAFRLTYNNAKEAYEARYA